MCVCVCLRQAESHVFVYAEVTYPAQVITLGPVYTGSHAMTRLLYKPSCLLTHFPQNTRGREWNLTNLSNLKHLICLIYEQTQHKYPTVSHFKLVLYRSVLYKTIIFNSSKFFFSRHWRPQVCEQETPGWRSAWRCWRWPWSPRQTEWCWTATSLRSESSHTRVHFNRNTWTFTQLSNQPIM